MEVSLHCVDRDAHDRGDLCEGEPFCHAQLNATTHLSREALDSVSQLFPPLFFQQCLDWTGLEIGRLSSQHSSLARPALFLFEREQCAVSLLCLPSLYFVSKNVSGDLE